MRGFASDNYAGVHPDVLAAVAEANTDHAIAYGDDPWTEALRERIRALFGPAAELHLVFNGTAANVLSLEALTQPWEAVICAATSHLHADECGAPERAGRKLLTVATGDGRLEPRALDGLMGRTGDQHAVQPRVVSVAQTTELGTRYAPSALRELAGWAHERDLLLHVDGARLFNAAAALGAELGEITTELGVDAVSLGATKNGAMGVEGVLFLRRGLGDGFPFLRKQSMQLASKMRFMAAQMLAMLDGELWRANAAHANAMARRLASAVGGVPGVRITQPVDANAVFSILPPGVAEPLASEWPFYVWDEATGEVRWMCAWDTRAEDVDAFAAAVAAACVRAAAPAA